MWQEGKAGLTWRARCDEKDVSANARTPVRHAERARLHVHLAGFEMAAGASTRFLSRKAFCAPTQPNLAAVKRPETAKPVHRLPARTSRRRQAVGGITVWAFSRGTCGCRRGRKSSCRTS
eukprot:12482015-Alexandrium_andersonii.AAC.1